MSPRLAILVVSVAANVLLAASAVFRNPTPPAPVAPVEPARKSFAGRSSSVARDSQPKPARNEPGISTSAAAQPQKKEFQWSDLESEDYKEYIARLRAFGVPEKTIRDIILADIAKLYRPRLAALRPNTNPQANPKFWENQSGFYSSYGDMSKEQREQMKVLQKEQKDLVETLLGKDVYAEIARESGYPSAVERQFGSVPQEKRDKVTELTSAYQQARSDVYAKSEGYIHQDTQAELKALQRKYRENLAAVLTPKELEDYSLRTSDVASNIRGQLGGFDPSEEEFRAIFKYKQGLDDLSPSGLSTPIILGGGAAPLAGNSTEERKAMLQKQKDLADELAKALPPERLKEFQLMDNFEYRNLFDAGIPKETVFKVADVRKQTDDAVQKVRLDRTLSSEQRTQALQQIRTATETELANLLGARRAKGYANQGGYWIRNISSGMVISRP
jgi:hypothetical protein